jgi:cardiolipin synthase A/B
MISTEPPSVSRSHIPFARCGSYPVRTGNLVRPLVDGEPAFRRICEAMEAARHSVWLTVTFLWPQFTMPDGRGSLFDVLERAAARGLDVRAVFWRHNEESSRYGHTFFGSPADHEMLRARGARFRVRWDRAQGAFCQHQKSWIVDAGAASETAFVGGINLNPHSLVSPGHAGAAPGSQPHNHDLYVEVTGPAATDVHHNFVQRWNEASERAMPDGVWGHDGEQGLSFPARLSAPRGEALVQIQRTVHARRYSDGHPGPQAQPFDIAGGERSILEQYGLAIDAARRSIYIENQALAVAGIIGKLADALGRGVAVIALVPGEPEAWFREARQKPEHRDLFEQLAALGRHEGFSLAGLAAPDGKGGRNSVYVHAKIMLIDDAWATIGSCNLHNASVLGNTEMNASFWDPQVVRALRCALTAEHLDRSTGDLDDRAALHLYQDLARANRRKRDAGDGDWQGNAYSLDPATYGE